MAKQTTALALRKQHDTVHGVLRAMEPEFMKVLPRHVTPERLVRVAMSQIKTTPKLMDCNRTSLFKSIMDAAQLGLVPDGLLGHAYLVPYGKQCTLIVGYKGYIKLAQQSGEVKTISAHEVCENDGFDYQYGSGQYLHHKPGLTDRGKVIAFYARASLTNGGEIFEVMERAKVDAIRDKAKAKGGPWKDHYVEMGRKTAIRRLAKYLPLSIQRAAALEDALDQGKTAHLERDPTGPMVVIDQETEPVIEDEPSNEETTKDALDQFAGEGDGTDEGVTWKTGDGDPMPTDAPDVDPVTGEVIPADLSSDGEEIPH